MKEKYLLSLDQGTTSSRCIIFNENGEIVSVAQKEYTQYYPHKGWVEHDAEEILSTQLNVAHEAIRKASLTPDDIAAIGITNQRETVIVWDRKTGKPVCHAIVWQCRRTAQRCDRLKEAGLTDMIRKKTGLIIDAYFSATKLEWILENVDGARSRAENGDLLFGTVDSWLIWNLTGGKVHATDPSNAARTMLFNINTCTWDDELLTLFNIPKSMMPDILASSGMFGYTELFGGRIAIAGVAGDQQASLFGQGCFEVGEAKNTYGTGGFMLMNTGKSPVFSENGLLTTIAWQRGNEITYALEGSTFVCGAAIQWLRDGLGLIKSASESETLASRVKDNGGIYVVPAFVGLGAPWWDAYARGAIFGITRGSTKEHIVRATLESMAYQTYDLLHTMEQDAKASLRSLKVDGGASNNDLLMSFHADIASIPIVRPSCVETTALGAAKLAGLGVGLYSSEKDTQRDTGNASVFTPKMQDSEREKLIRYWHKAVNRTLAWTLDE